VIDRVGLRHRLEVRVIYIDGNPGLEAAFGSEIPVIFIEGEMVFRYRVDEMDLERKLRQLWSM
jgi:hypothetical protein